MTSSESAYQLETAGNCTIVTLAPKLSNEQWGDIHDVGKQLVDKLNEMQTTSLMVDLSAMEYIGSSTVALVVRLWKTVKERDGTVAVISKHPVVREVLQIAGLNKVWTIVNTRDEAMAELGVTQSSGGMWLLCLGLLAALVAVAGLVILFSPAVAVKQQLVQLLLFGGAGLGTLLGLVNTIREKGARRFVSLIALLACLGIIVAGVAKSSGWEIPPKQESKGDEAGGDETDNGKTKNGETQEAKTKEDQPGKNETKANGAKTSQLHDRDRLPLVVMPVTIADRRFA